MNYTIDENRIIELVVEMISKQMDSYYIHEKSGQYAIQDKEGKCLINYGSNNKELYYDYSLREFIEKFMPFMEFDTFKKAVKEYFNSEFPELQVKRVYGANIVKG